MTEKEYNIFESIVKLYMIYCKDKFKIFLFLLILFCDDIEKLRWLNDKL